jgi:hypothetical protein
MEKKIDNIYRLVKKQCFSSTNSILLFANILEFMTSFQIEQKQKKLDTNSAPNNISLNVTLVNF